MDGLLDKYIELLKVDDRKGVILARYYCELFEQDFTGDIIKLFGRLNKIYGTTIVLQAVSDMATIQDLKPENPAALLNTICKNAKNKPSNKKEEFYFDTEARHKQIEQLIKSNKEVNE